MKKIVTLAALLIVLFSFMVTLEACRNEGLLVDKTQPWYDDAGFHNHFHCGVYPTTRYITIMDDKDDESYSSSSMGYYDNSFYKSKGYRYSRKRGHTYLTYPVSVPEYQCQYV